MKDTIWRKKIPTLLGLILIIIGVGLTSYLVNNGVLFNTKASPSQTPENVKITNVSDSSFTVSYTTQDNVFGSINYGPTASFGQSALDDRDSLSRAVVSHTLHSITANSLKPDTSYYFSILSGDNKYLNNDKPFTITTGPQIQASPSAQKPATGKILLPNGSFPKEAIVYLFTDQSETISTLVTDGNYILPLNSLRKKDLSEYITFDPKSVIKIVAFGEGSSSNVLLNEDQISPVPSITLSNNYDFTSSQSPLSTDSAKTASTSGFPSFGDGPSDTNPTIDSPTKDQGLSDNQPVFKGTGQPNETVEITIHSSDQILDQVTTDSNGNWQYRPSTPLSPGNHTISIATKDASGILKTITQNFTVYAKGTQIADTSSTKATLSTTPTPLPTTSPVPLVTPSPTPTTVPTLAPSLTPTLTPTDTPIISTISATPSPSVYITNTGTPSGNTLPPTGTNLLTVGLLGIGLALIGIFLFIMTRGGIPL